MNRERGFTLIELLVVIAIIGILAAIIAPNAYNAILKAKVAKLESDMDTLRKAALLHYADTGRIPPDMAFTGGAGEDPGFMENIHNIEGWDGPYLEQWKEHTPFGGKYAWVYACSPLYASQFEGAYNQKNWQDDDGRLKVWYGSALWDEPEGTLKLPQRAIDKIDNDVDGGDGGNKGYWQYIHYDGPEQWTYILHKEYIE